MLKIYKIVKEIIPDNMVIRFEYYQNFKKKFSLKNCQTFNEKINYIKLSNWLEDKSDYVDKYKVREFIEKEIGIEYLPKIYGVYNKSEDFDLNVLPQSFVLKLNNGSGCNLVVKDKHKLCEAEVKKILNQWLKSNFYKFTREKQYKYVNQLIIAEEYLEDNSGELRDYKFFCFKGEVKFIQVDTNRSQKHVQTFYDKEWNKLDFTYVSEKTTIIEEKPTQLDKMIEIAEKLSQNFPFVRVDLYNTGKRIYFGELTFTPNNGMQSFNPIEKELEFGSWIDLSEV